MNKTSKITIISLIILVFISIISLYFLPLVNSWTDDGTLVQNVSGCGDLSTENATYYLNTSLTATNTCFNITADNVTLDCQGNMIVYGSAGGTSTYGIRVDGRNFTTIKNCLLNESTTGGTTKHGIVLTRASNSTIENNTVRVIDSATYAIYLTTSSKQNTIINNNATTGGTGSAIYLITNSNSNLIRDNKFKATSSGNGIYVYTTSKWNNVVNNSIEVTSGYGVYLYTANETNVHDNIITSTTGYGVFIRTAFSNNLTNNFANSTGGSSYALEGTSSQHFNHTLGEDNLAEGKPVNYTYNADNLVFDSIDYTPYGEVIFAWSRNLTITNSNFSDDSLNFFSTNGSVISYNKIFTTKGWGILINSGSEQNNITFNNITTRGTNGVGIFLNLANFSTILSNNISTSGATTAYGIYLLTASNATITDNIVLTNGTPTGNGIVLSTNSKDNTINSNIITTKGAATGYGIYLFTKADYNDIFDNTITTKGAATGYGIYVATNSVNNLFVNNSITTHGAASGHGIVLSINSSGNMFYNHTIIARGVGGYGIDLLVNTTNNTFSGMKIFTNSTTSYAIYFADTNASLQISDSILNSTIINQEVYVKNFGKPSEWNFTNVTRENGNRINVTWIAGANGTLNMRWYLDVNVTNSTGSALENVNISVWDNADTFQFSKLTDATGFIGQQVLTEYQKINNSLGITTYYSNYTINVTSAAYINTSLSVNMSSNQLLNIILLSDMTAPSVSLLTEFPVESVFNDYDHSQYYEFNATISDTSGLSTVLLEFNGTNYSAKNISDIFNVTFPSLAAGYYEYTWYANDTLGNVNITTGNYTVHKATSSGWITWTNMITYGTVGDAEGTNIDLGNADVYYNLYRNFTGGTSNFILVLNPDNSVLGAGMYDYKYEISGGQNYSQGNLTMGSLTVLQANSEVNLTLNNSEGNKTLEFPDTINLNCTRITGEGIIKMYNNLSLINSGSTPIGNTTLFNSVFNYNITCTYPSTQNYTFSFETYYVLMNDTTAPTITLIEPLSLAEDTDGFVDFSFNVTDYSTISSCSLYLENELAQTDNSITRNITQIFTVEHIIELDSLDWYVSCNDSLNNRGNSSVRLLDTRLGEGHPEGGGGGGGGSASYPYVGIINETACNLTYEYLLKNGQVYYFIDELKLKNNLTEDWTTIKYYIDDWQLICSNLINRTLKPKIVCDSIYFFILNNSYNFTTIDLNNLKNSLKPEIDLSLPLLNYYYINYDTLCLGYSNKLPKRKIEIINLTAFSLFNYTNCSLELGNRLIDWSIGNLKIDKNFTCEQINIWRWFIKLEENGEGYIITGVKFWFILTIILMILIAFFSTYGISKYIKKIRKKLKIEKK